MGRSKLTNSAPLSFPLKINYPASQDDSGSSFAMLTKRSRSRRGRGADNSMASGVIQSDPLQNSIMPTATGAARTEIESFAPNTEAVESFKTTPGRGPFRVAKSGAFTVLKLYARWLDFGA